MLSMGTHTRSRCTLIYVIESMMNLLFTTSTFMFSQRLNNGEVMFSMVNILPKVICSNWKENILSVLTNGARNITRRYQGVVDRLYNASTKMLVCLWCGAHQSGLVIG